MKTTFFQFAKIFEKSPILVVIGVIIVLMSTVTLSVKAVPTFGYYVPHRFCMVDPLLIAIHAVGDLIIGISYLVISFELFKIAKKAAVGKWLLISFGSFIVACGMTHFMEDVTLYIALYRFSAVVKLFCAIASIATAAVLVNKRHIIENFFKRQKE